MIINSRLMIGLATAAGLGLVIIVYKYKHRTRDAVKVLKYLKIDIVASVEECDKVVEELRRRSNDYHALGFDCEWVSINGKRQPVALIQLSSFDGYCGLFRLSLLKNVPETLKQLLEDTSVYKVGVGPYEDGNYLFSDYGVSLKSSLDLRHMALRCGDHPGGLASLSKNILGITLDKSWRVRCSDWEAGTLTERQKNYAAADAHVAIKIFAKLFNMMSGKAKFEDLDIISRFSDMRFKAQNSITNLEKNRNKQSKDKATNRLKSYHIAIRSKPLYHNCYLEAPDGELLCTCDNAKAQWYVDKQLADVVKETPFTVRLRFEPAGRSVGDVGRYYQIAKENRCVVCGSSDSYIRKNVVPREYRKYFPDIMKEHSSHDVVLLCVGCHNRSNMLVREVRSQLAEKCNAPIAELGNSRLIEDSHLKKIKSAARALTYQSKKHVLPQKRIKELEQIVLDHYPEYETVTDELLEEASNLESVYENTDYESHGDKVVEYYLRHESLLKLEELWREHFLETMKPKYLPPLWSVKHNEERLRVRFNEGRLNEDDLKLLGHVRFL